MITRAGVGKLRLTYRPVRSRKLVPLSFEGMKCRDSYPFYLFTIAGPLAHKL